MISILNLDNLIHIRYFLITIFIHLFYLLKIFYFLLHFFYSKNNSKFLKKVR
jgi:hypothetical protein